jgi:hypothetical protein
MQDCGDADLRAEVLGIGGNRQHGIRRGLEQKRVDDGLVLVSDGSDLGGQRKDGMEIRDLEQLGLALLHPGKCLTALTFRAMTIATTAVRNDGVGARGVLAARDIAAKRRGATGLDRAHHFQLCVAHVAAVGITPSGAVIAEDIRDFQSGTLHDGRRDYFGGSVLGRSGVN